MLSKSKTGGPEGEPLFIYVCTYEAVNPWQLPKKDDSWIVKQKEGTDGISGEQVKEKLAYI